MSVDQIESDIAKLIHLISESDSKYRLDREVVNVVFRLSMDPEAHVPDTLTRIRALPTVTVVGQRSKVFRPSQAGGKSYIDIYVKFLPLSATLFKNLKQLGRKIKSLPGVQIARVQSVDDRDYLHDGKPLVV
jgi:hypothetical protein